MPRTLKTSLFLITLLALRALFIQPTLAGEGIPIVHAVLLVTNLSTLPQSHHRRFTSPHRTIW